MSIAVSQPTVLPVNPENIPSQLKAIPNWMRWKVGRQKDNGKYDKLPLNRYGNVVSAHERL